MSQPHLSDLVELYGGPLDGETVLAPPHSHALITNLDEPGYSYSSKLSTVFGRSVFLYDATPLPMTVTAVRK